MLVLSRKKGERIVIDSNIHVTVLGVRGNRVQLGFIAPGEVPILREEIFRRTQEESGRNLVLPYGEGQRNVSRESA